MCRVCLLSSFFLFISFLALSQADPAIDPVTGQWIVDNTGGNNLDISIGTFTLREDSTFSFRKVNGVKTGTYFDMTKSATWNSTPYKQGYLTRVWGGNGGFAINYRLHRPGNYDNNYAAGYPLILFMHGAGERGNCWSSQNPPCYWGNSLWSPGNNVPVAPTDAMPTAQNPNGPKLLNNDLVLANGGQAHDAAVNRAAGKYPSDPSLLPNAWPGFVLFPQNMNSWSSEDPQHAIRIVRLLIQKYRIDPNRIFVHGLSDGGAGTYEILKRAPWLFTAGLPMSAITDSELIEKSNSSHNYLDNITHIPLWQFQGGQDTGPKPATTLFYQNTFKNNGMSVRYTLYPTLGHSVWNNAYAEPDFFLWMRNKNKSDISVRYGVSSICSSSGAGVEMRLAYGFWGYQWQKDGVTIPGATSAIYTATIPGTYRARFSRVQNPTEAQWNRWSNPVIVTQSNDPAPVITAVGSIHLPGVNNENTVTLMGPPNNKYYYWYKDGVKMNFSPSKDTLAYITPNQFGQGDYTLQVAGITNCITASSAPVSVRVNSPQNINAPDNLSGVVVSPSSINLFWKDESNNETAFEVYRALSTSTKYSLITVTGEDAISYLDATLKPDSTYKYLIRAISSTGQSAKSSVLTIGTGSDNQPPSIPQNLVVVTDSVTSSNKAAIRLKWDASTDNSGIKEYVVSWTGIGVKDSSQTVTQPANGSLTTCLITKLARDKGYNFTVVAHDLGNPSNSSAPSNQIYVETIEKGLNYYMSEGNWTTLYGYPTNSTTAVNWQKIEDKGHVDTVSIAPRKQDDFFYIRFYGYINIKTSGKYTFALTNKEGGALYVGAGGDPITTLYPNNPTTNFTDFGTSTRWINNDGIKPGGDPTTVTVTKNSLGVGVCPISVIFFENQGPGEDLELMWKTPANPNTFVTIPASAFTSIRTPLTPTPPAIPTSLVATATGQSTISLTWVSSDTTEVYRSTATNGTYSLVGQSANHSFGDINLNPNVTYYYKVRAVNHNGASAYTSIVNATTTSDTSAPTIPTGLNVVSSTFTNASLTWTVSTDNVGVTLYTVYANGSSIGTSPNNVFTATGLVPFTTYSFTVTAKDASGNVSDQSGAASITTNQPDIYYYDGAGSLADVTNWGKQTNGTGTQPSTFSTNGQYFVVTNTQTASLTSSWSIGGDVSKVIVASGTTLTINNPLSGGITAQDNSIINVNSASMPTFESLSPTSTVNFNTYTTIPQATYGNVNLNGSGDKVVSAGSTTIAGNLTVTSGVTLKGVPGNGSTLVLSGNLTASGGATRSDIPSDNTISLTLNGTGTSTISTGTDLILYSLNAASNKTVNFTNTSGTPVNIKLGSSNGGGLALENGSVLQVGNNKLAFQFASAVNASGQTGQIDIAGGDIDFTSSASGNSTFNFGPVGKTVHYFNVNLTGGAAATIGQPVTLTNGLKIKQGTFNANGNVTLESNATTTASIYQIENGGVINGAVTVKRYAAAQGQAYRYVSFPVAGVKVADLQANNILIYGNFTGTNLNTTPTLYKYTTDWIPFPASSNQEQFEKGRGYSFLNFGGIAPTTWQSTGVPYQGDVTFTNLVGGTVAGGNGWNLLGNPYAAPIVWDNSSNWVTSGVGNTVYIRNNHDGGFDWQYWNASTHLGPLTGGIIPSGQAFWIQASTSTPSVTVKESAKSADTGSQNTNFFREASSLASGTFTLTLSGNGNSDPTFLYIAPEGSDVYDKQRDSEKRTNSYFNLSTFSSDSVKLAINQLSNYFGSCQKTVGLNLENTAPGHYTLQTDAASWEGAVILKDHYLNSLVSLEEGKSYSFDITSDTKSFGKNRFTLELSSPDIDVSNPALTAALAPICGGSPVVVNLKNVQNGVNYTVVNNSGKKISNTVIGASQPIDFSVSTDNLTQGSNTLFVVAELNGCNSIQLPTSGTVTYSETPVAVLSTPSTSICSGETQTLTATGALSGGSYKWYEATSSSVILQNVTGDKFQTAPLSGSKTYVVTAINKYGCESRMTGISINVISLDTPQVSQSGSTFYSSSDHNNQWLKDGQPINGMTGISFQPIEPGVYSVRTTADGCSKESDPIYYLVSGLEQPASSNSYFVVYPNPTNQHDIRLRGNLTSPASEDVSIELIDINGKVHSSTLFAIEDFNNGVKLDTSSDSLAPGVYLIVMKVGSITTKRKVMIH